MHPFAISKLLNEEPLTYVIGNELRTHARYARALLVVEPFMRKWQLTLGIEIRNG